MQAGIFFPTISNKAPQRFDGPQKDDIQRIWIGIKGVSFVDGHILSFAAPFIPLDISKRTL